MSVNELIVLGRKFLLYNVRDYILGVVVSSHSIDNMIDFSLSHTFCAREFSCSMSSQLYWSCVVCHGERRNTNMYRYGLVFGIQLFHFIVFCQSQYNVPMMQDIQLYQLKENLSPFGLSSTLIYCIASKLEIQPQRQGNNHEYQTNQTTQ